MMKQTEIGLIPDDWEEKCFNDIAIRITDGSHFSPKEVDVGYYMPSVKDMRNTGFDYSDCKKISKQDYISLVRMGCKPDINDVLIAKDGSILKYAFTQKSNEDIVILSSIAIIKPNLQKICPDYLVHYVTNNRFIDYAIGNFKTGTGVPRIVLKGFAKLKIQYPPTLAEQQRIAKALSDVDALISTTEKFIQKKKDIKQGIMQNLLTGKKRLPGFGPQTKSPTYKQTELGPIPEDWEVKVFGDYASIVRGGSPRPIQNFLTTNSDGINWIKIGDVKPEDKYIVSTEEKIIPEGKSRSREVHKGDFILSNSMSFGRPYILQIDGCIHDGWLAIQNYQETFDSDFLYYLLGSDEIFQQYIEMAAGSSVQNLNKEKVAKLLVPIFDKKEQTAIATVLSSMDKEIETLNTKLEKYHNLKTAMMQQLLTGKIRL